MTCITYESTEVPYVSVGTNGEDYTDDGYLQYDAVAAGTVIQPWSSAPSVGAAIQNLKVLPRVMRVSIVNQNSHIKYTGNPTVAQGRVALANDEVIVKGIDNIKHFKITPIAGVDASYRIEVFR